MGRLEYHREHLIELEEALIIRIKSCESAKAPVSTDSNIIRLFQQIDLTKRVIKFIEEGKV